MDNFLEILYNRQVETPSDINEHLPTLRKYTEGCDLVLELGVRGICSTWAFLAGRPKKLISYDIYPPSNWGGDISLVEYVASQEGIEYEFVIADVLETELPECDLMFIDTWHTYDQLSAELKMHSSKVKKYIILHDTTSYGFVNESIAHANSFKQRLSGKQGLKLAIDEFLSSNTNWSIHKVFNNNNGLTVLISNAHLL